MSRWQGTSGKASLPVQRRSGRRLSPRPCASSLARARLWLQTQSSSQSTLLWCPISPSSTCQVWHCLQPCLLLPHEMLLLPIAGAVCAWGCVNIGSRGCCCHAGLASPMLCAHAGLTKVPIDGQPKSIVQDLENMARTYIKVGPASYCVYHLQRGGRQHRLLPLTAAGISPFLP